ncbi:DUF4422 domain-containing protein [bacterium]|nr:DUF4422 domain-containing protein [bacterium]
MKKNIKILISYHKPFKLLKDSTFLPIHVGRTLCKTTTKDGKISKREKKWLFKKLIGDNRGENISGKNRSHSELTAQYWAWKHYDRLGTPDYIGFMHYRRHFEFVKPYKKFFKLSPDARKQILEKSLEDVDMIVPAKCPLAGETNYEQYINYPDLHKKDLDTMLEVLGELYPDYKMSAEKYMKDSMAYFCNMYILKKDVFFEYENLLFNVLRECEKRMDISKYDVNERRVMGHLSERLFGIYVTKNREKYRIKEMPWTLISEDNFMTGILTYFNRIKNLLHKLRPLL